LDSQNESRNKNKESTILEQNDDLDIQKPMGCDLKEGASNRIPSR